MKTLKLLVYWLPRIISILAIGFILLLGADSFDPKITLQDQLIGFMMHSIPGVILIIILAVAWKWELIGGIIYVLVGIFFSVFIYLMNYHRLVMFKNPNPVGVALGIVMIIGFPFIVSGGMFIWSHFLREKQQLNQNSEIA